MIGTGAAVLGGAAVLFVVLLGIGLAWSARVTDGARYFGRTLAQRRALKRRIERLGRVAVPFGRALAAILPLRRLPTIEFRGVCGPALTCSRRSFEATARFEPDERDVFVSRQRCGGIQ